MTSNGITETTKPDIRIIGVGDAGHNMCEFINNQQLASIDSIISFIIPTAKENNVTTQVPVKHPRSLNLALINDNEKYPKLKSTATQCIGMTHTQFIDANEDNAESTCDLNSLPIIDMNTVEIALNGCDVVIIVTDFGDEAASTIAPIIASTAKAQDKITIVIGNHPFTFEGCKRTIRANTCINEFAKIGSLLLQINRHKISTLLENDTSIANYFRTVDKIVFNLIKMISKLIIDNCIENDATKLISEIENLRDAQ